MITTETAFYPPPAPQTVEDTGLSPDLILQILTKTMHLSGELSGTELPWHSSNASTIVKSLAARCSVVHRFVTG